MQAIFGRCICTDSRRGYRQQRQNCRVGTQDRRSVRSCQIETFAAFIENGIDGTSVEGATSLPYKIA